jgi:multiple sugar transport system substrate-binding protein
MMADRPHRNRAPRVFQGWGWFLLAAIACCPGCGKTSLDGRTQIGFWNGFTGPDGRTMLKLVREFNEQNSDIRVTMQRSDWNTYYNKLFVAGRGGRAPEVFVITTDRLDRFVEGGILQAFDALIQGEPSFPVDDFERLPWEGAQFNGRQHAIPLDIHPMGMFYNRKLLKQAGVADAAGEARPPRNREEFVQTLRAVRALDTGAAEYRTWGAVLPNFRTFALSLMRQNRGEFFNEDFTRCTLAGHENVEALEFIVKLSTGDPLIAPLKDYSYFDSWINFRQGHSGMAFEGIFMLGDLKKQTSLDYMGAPVPVLFDQPAAYAGSHNLCMPAGLDEETTQAAWRFIRFLSEHSIDWADAGQIPARKSFRETPEFRAMKVQHAFAQEIPHVFYAPQVPFIFEFFTEVDFAVESSMRGNASPAEALAEAERKVNMAIARRREAP